MSAVAPTAWAPAPAPAPEPEPVTRRAVVLSVAASAAYLAFVAVADAVLDAAVDDCTGNTSLPSACYCDGAALAVGDVVWELAFFPIRIVLYGTAALVTGHTQRVGLKALAASLLVGGANLAQNALLMRLGVGAEFFFVLGKVYTVLALLAIARTGPNPRGAWPLAAITLMGVFLTVVWVTLMHDPSDAVLVVQPVVAAVSENLSVRALRYSGTDEWDPAHVAGLAKMFVCQFETLRMYSLLRLGDAPAALAASLALSVATEALAQNDLFAIPTQLFGFGMSVDAVASAFSKTKSVFLSARLDAEWMPVLMFAAMQAGSTLGQFILLDCDGQRQARLDFDGGALLAVVVGEALALWLARYVLRPWMAARHPKLVRPVHLWLPRPNSFMVGALPPACLASMTLTLAAQELAQSG